LSRLHVNELYCRVIPDIVNEEVLKKILQANARALLPRHIGAGKHAQTGKQ